MEFAFFSILVIFFAIIAVIFYFLRVVKKTSILEAVFVILYLLSIPIFWIGMEEHSIDYFTAIDPIDYCYTPFGSVHFPTLIFYFLAFHISAVLVWWRGRQLPPLTLVISLVFLLIGFFVNIAVIIQVFVHNTNTMGINKGDNFFFFPMPILNMIMYFSLINKVMNEEKNKAQTRVYTNKFLNQVNQFLANRYDETSWALIFTIPVFLFSTLILILFGQEPDAIIKAFTDTTTWTFSQKEHPPVLDHSGHYLCTVAAKGSPNVVQPIFIGKRHGRKIIVNRQLQIANAFEEMIQNFSPKIHYFIRKNYDRYGYNLSLKINTQWASNLTYFLMKPLEWLFLFSLYLLVESPEKKIRRQYQP